jgi:hypothetical protein
LQRSQQENLPQIDRNEISVYSGELTTLCVIQQVKKIKAAFPSLPIGFYEVLEDRIKELNFSDQKLIDAVNNLIDTCIYPTPTIASLLSWDKRIKLYSYYDMVNMTDKYGASVWDNYKAISIQGISTRVYASKIDIEKYNLEII